MRPYGATPDTTIPFTVIGTGHKALDIGAIFQAITAQDITECLDHPRKNTASGLDGTERKNTSEQDIRDILKTLFNFILISKLQSNALNNNGTILIAKQGKDASRVENYRPLTIGSLISRTYWGIIDKKLREVVSFPLGKKALFQRQAASTMYIY